MSVTPLAGAKWQVFVLDSVTQRKHSEVAIQARHNIWALKATPTLASIARPSDSSASPALALRKKPLNCWMYRRTPVACAARNRLPPPSSRSFRSP